MGSVSLLNSLEVYLPEKPPKHFMVYLTHSVGNNSAGRTNSLKFMKSQMFAKWANLRRVLKTGKKIVLSVL